MNRVHTSYGVSKMLKEFLGESAPEPMVNWYMREGVNPLLKDMPVVLEIGPRFPPDGKSVPAYQLHDLLSKPFCEAFSKNLDSEVWPVTHDDPEEVFKRLSTEYFDGGMEAVEKALTEMMEGK